MFASTHSTTAPAPAPAPALAIATAADRDATAAVHSTQVSRVLEGSNSVHASNVSASILSQAGLQELIARDEDQMVMSE